MAEVRQTPAVMCQQANKSLMNISRSLIAVAFRDASADPCPISPLCCKGSINAAPVQQFPVQRFGAHTVFIVASSSWTGLTKLVWELSRGVLPGRRPTARCARSHGVFILRPERSILRSKRPAEQVADARRGGRLEDGEEPRDRVEG